MLEGSLSPRTPLSQDAPDRAAYKHQSCRSQFWGLEIRGQGAGVARRGPSPRSDFLLCAHTAEGAGELSGGGLCYQDTHPGHEGSTHTASSAPEGPTS